MSAAIPLMRPRPTRELRLPPPDQLAVLGTPETAKEISARLYQGALSASWVLEHHAPDAKFYRGRTAVWFPQKSNEWYAKVYVPQQVQRAQDRRKKRA